MPFFARYMPIFDRSGQRLGRLEKWSVTGPRSYRLNQPGNFDFFIPRNDGDTSIITGPKLPTFIGSDGSQVAAGTSITFDRPSGTDQGDRVLALVVEGTAGGVITPPNNTWVLEGRARAHHKQINVYSLRITSDANPATYVFTSSISQTLAGGVLTYRRARRFRPIEATSTTNDRGKVPVIKAPLKNEWVVAITVADRNSTWTVPTGWTSLFSATPSGMSVRAAHKSLDEAGKIDPAHFTATNEGGNLTLALIVQEQPSTEALLTRDNLVYIANDLNMRGWGGPIENVEYDDTGAHVRALSGMALLNKLETDPIEQDEGLAQDAAARLVYAAAAKQASNGDLMVEFKTRSSPPPRPNYGVFKYGPNDILAGLQQLAGETLCEFYDEAWIDENTGRLRIAINWGSEAKIDRAGTVIKDGVGGNVTPGTRVAFSSSDMATFARLVGQQTRMSEFLDYRSVTSVLKEITPEVSISIPSIPGGPSFRRREGAIFSVNWGYSRALQREMAREVQRRYVDVYKTFLYAHHDRWGEPFLFDGYRWVGATPEHSKQMRMSRMRTVNAMALVGEREIVTNPNPNIDTDARLDILRRNLTLDIADVTAAAYDFAHPRRVWLARANTGTVQRVAGTSLDDEQFLVAATGETLKGIATDEREPRQLWTVVGHGAGSTVRRYDMGSGGLMSAWGTTANLSDLAVDTGRGLIYTSRVNINLVEIRDINSGVVLRSYTAIGRDEDDDGPDPPAVTGLSLTGRGSFLYCMLADGQCVIEHAQDGAFAGLINLPFANAAGIFVDDINAELWACLPNKVEVYWAVVAVASTGGSGPVDGMPGFDRISDGTFIHMVMAKSRKQAGYKVPPRPEEPDIPEGPPTPVPPDPTPDPPEGYQPPIHNEHWANIVFFGSPPGEPRRDPLKKPPILAVLHFTGYLAYSNTSHPPGIWAGQATYLEIEHEENIMQQAMYHTYVARNGAYSYVGSPIRYASRRIAAMHSPRQGLNGISLIINRKKRTKVRDYDPDTGKTTWYWIEEKNCKFTNGQWVCVLKPNEFVFRQIGLTASTSFPATNAQLETAAYLIALDAQAKSSPINRHTTVLAHSDFDAYNTQCPFPPGKREANMGKIIRRAIVIKKLLMRSQNTPISDDDR